MKLLIIGETGAGKSTSLKNLDPETTFLLQGIQKELPWKGSQNVYKEVTKENGGNLFYVKDLKILLASLKNLSKNDAIKTIVVDDLHYVMANSIMSERDEKEYKAKYQKASMAWMDIIDLLSSLSKTKDIIIMTHPEVDEKGFTRAKTVGKAIDRWVGVEAQFSVVLYAYSDAALGNVFKTNNNGDGTSCKSPDGMFEDEYVANDIVEVLSIMRKYYQ